MTWWSKVLALVAAALMMIVFLSALSEPLFKKIFGRGRSRAGKSLDQLLLTGLVLAGTLIGLWRLISPNT